MGEQPKPCDLLVTGDLILTLDTADRVLNNGAIAIADRAIVDIGPADELGRRWGAAATVDGKGRIVMPGMVNVHNHTPLMITRGMIEDIGFAPMYTPGIPQGHWLREEDAYALSSLGMYELVRAGCTTVVDFRVEQEDSVYPMVPSNSDLRDMIRRPTPMLETGADP